MRKASLSLIAAAALLATPLVVAQTSSPIAPKNTSSATLGTPTSAIDGLADDEADRAGLEAIFGNPRPTTLFPSRTGESGIFFGGPLGPPPQVVCPGSGITEPEPCGGPEANGGCANSFCGDQFQLISSGDTYCGTAFADGGVRDLDTYSFTVAAPSVVTIDFTAEFTGSVALAEIPTGDCTSFFQIEEDFSDAATPVTLTRVVPAGTYLIVVTTETAAEDIFFGIPCGSDNDYLLTLDVTPVADCNFSGNVTELEACGTQSNAGCDAMMALQAEPVQDGDTVVGNLTNGAIADLDAWSFTLAGDTEVSIDLTSQAATNVVIFDNDCATGPNQVSAIAVADGNCATTNLTAILPAGDFSVIVFLGDEFGFNPGGVPCGSGSEYSFDFSTTAVTPSCPLTIPAGSIMELDASCGATPDANDGCNGPGTNFETLTLGETYNGEISAEMGTRDLDWYSFTLASAQTVDVTLNGEIPTSLVIFDGACPPTLLFSVVTTAGSNEVTVPVDLPAGSYNAVLGVGDAVGPIFDGFPCSTNINCYYFSISAQGGSTPCVGVTAGTLEADCATGELSITDLTPGTDYDSIDFTVSDSTGQIDSGTIPGPLGVGLPLTTVLGTYPGPDFYTVDFTANCSSGGTTEFDATVGIFQYNGETDVIFDGELRGIGFGCNDSVAALESALGSIAGASVLTIPGGPGAYDCISDFPQGTNVYVMKGTFPNDTLLTVEDGDAIAGFVQIGINVYLEGGDIWGFGTDNASRNFDGVAGRFGDGDIVPDGDDSLDELSGNAATGLDTTGFGLVAYNGDNRSTTIFGGDDFTDQLSLQGELGTMADDPAGSTAEAVWNNSANSVGETPYLTTIAYTPSDSAFGRVISQSWEIGGFGGDINALVSAYRDFFGSTTGGGQQFVRGEINGDGARNIADAVFLLNQLFIPGSPTAPCQKSADVNDDGSVNIADAIFLLNELFVPGSPTAPAPNPGCGDDPTMDMLPCDSFSPCP